MAVQIACSPTGVRMKIDFNPEFLQALELLEGGSSIFLTGKAGTGKSTLLRHFLEVSDRRVLVAAPTGVAALNVQGETIHRLFSFPAWVNPDFVASGDYYPRRNAKVLKSIDTLVIDEISMVRADLLDSVNIALKRFGPKVGATFGGVQAVFVGDPYQLPPVVADSEQDHFRTRYPTPYFFSADLFKEFDYELVQLERVYRQSNPEFVDLLNAIRTGDADSQVFDRLNERFDPNFEPPTDEFWVTLTTTNKMAESINDKRLEALSTPEIHHDSAQWGSVEDSDKPVPDRLRFKVGAQVMLVNNDPGGEWVNGSMGVVLRTSTEQDQLRVQVELLDGGTAWVGPHTWEIIRPVIEGKTLTYEITGTYTQLPFKPAWAVTIHKSQGKTLDKVVVALGRGTFADGQLYVALSRATSLEGLVLKSEVKARHVLVEREVTRFLARGEQAPSISRGEAFLAIHSTGVSRLDGIFEVAVILRERSGTIREYSSLINPLRDIGRAAEQAGVSATDLQLAPTLKEAWPLFARLMHGYSLVAHGLPTVQSMVERQAEMEDERIDLGLGYDTLQISADSLSEVARRATSGFPDSPRALDKARLTMELYSTANRETVPVSPYEGGTELQRVARLLTRDGSPVRDMPTNEIEYGDFVSLGLATLQGNVSVLIADNERAAAGCALSLDAVSKVHDEIWKLLMLAAQRDSQISIEELDDLKWSAKTLGVERIELEASATGPTIGCFLKAGMRVCFTGSAVDLHGNALEKEELRNIARIAGLETVESVTIKKCDLVVAADAASMSGKAKKARDLGKPVYGVDEFLSWAQDA